MTAPASARTKAYDRFVRHNRRVGVLRWAVPVAGTALLALPILEVAANRLADALPFGGLRLEHDTLVIAGPRFEGRTATGSNYAMAAARAETRVGDLDTTDLFDLTVDIVDGADYTARADFLSATWTMSTERLISNEDVRVADSTGAQGVLAGVDIDWPAQIITSEGPVRFTFETGASLNAQTMIHDIDAAHWRFTQVSLDMVPEPDSGADRDPFSEETPDATP